LLLDYAHSRRAAVGRRSRLAVVAWLFSFLTMPSCALMMWADTWWKTASFAFALTPSVLTLACCVIALIRIDRAAIPVRGRDLAIFGGAISMLSMLLVVAMKLLIELSD